MRLKRFFFLPLFLCTAVSYGQTVTDYLHVPGPVKFDSTAYYLAWTSHPDKNYYKQEYLPQGDSLEKFNRLLMIETISGAGTAKELADAKVAELEEMKKTNPVVNYMVYENNGEYMIDFLVSENSPDGKYLLVLERNIYRYKLVTDASGKVAVLLFATSQRAYGNDTENFLLNLKSGRENLVMKTGMYEIPAVVIPGN